MESADSTGLVEWVGVTMCVAAPFSLALIVWRRWYHLDRTTRPVTLAPAEGLMLFAGIFLLGIAGAVAIRPLAGIETEQTLETMTLRQHTLLLLGSSAGQMIGVVLFAWVMRRSPGTRVSVPASIGIGIATFVLVWPVVAATSVGAGRIAEWLRDEPVGPIAHQTLEQLVESPGGLWFAVMTLLVIVIVPVIEEVTYRGVIQRTLSGFDIGRWPPILITSLIFTAMHAGAAMPHALPALFILSLGFGWAAERTGRLVAPITMHILFNAGNLLLATLGTSPGAAGG